MTTKDKIVGVISDVCFDELQYVKYSHSDNMGWEKLCYRIAQQLLNKFNVEEKHDEIQKPRT